MEKKSKLQKRKAPTHFEGCSLVKKLKLNDMSNNQEMKGKQKRVIRKREKNQNVNTIKKKLKRQINAEKSNDKCKEQCTSMRQDSNNKENIETDWLNTPNSILHQSDSTFHKEAKTSDLFEDIDYYMQKVSKTMIIGQFPAENGVLYSTEIHLEQSAFRTLNTKENDVKSKWIDSDVIDAFVLSQIHEWRNVSYINTRVTYNVIGDYADNFFNVLSEVMKEKMSIKLDLSLFSLLKTN